MTPQKPRLRRGFWPSPSVAGAKALRASTPASQPPAFAYKKEALADV
jgi:hypothetical protein